MFKKDLKALAEKEVANILLVRTDRIGDVVLSTPVISSIRKAKPNWKITMLLRPMVADLMEGHGELDEVMRLGTNHKPSLSNRGQLTKILKDKNFDCAIHLFSDFWISLSCWQAGIPVNIGPASKIAQIFYSHKLTQHRSKGTRHETDYNLELLKPLGIEPVRKASVPYSNELPESYSSLLSVSGKNVGIFPGMGGSARNWRPEHYAKVADELASNGVNVIFFAGPGEEEIVTNVESLTSKKHKRLIGSSLKEFAGFVKRLSCFVAPSTGPLHIASAVGTPVVGIYCPIRVCLPQRWGPIGEKDIALVPDLPACEKCAMDNCKEYDCMDKLPVEKIVNAVMERL